MTDFLRGSEYIVPRRIHADRAARELQIDWPDGHETSYDFTTLRWLCPCAFCRGEAGMPGWLDSGPTLTEAQTTLTDLQMVGQYAVAPTWADGHHTGYYTFDRLREACPCAEDVARRAKVASAAPVGGRAHEHRAGPSGTG
jgi:DUF971 family protein